MMKSVTDAVERGLMQSGLVKRVTTRVRYWPRSVNPRYDKPHQGNKERKRRLARMPKEATL